LPAAGVGLMLAGSSLAANAREARTSFAVTVTVLAMARIEQQTEPATIEITAADLRRGFLDVRQPTTLLVRSNCPSGFALDLTTVAPLLESVIVHGLTGEQSLGSEGGSLVQRWRGAQSMNLSLTFRLVLAPGLAAGTYPWPVRVAVRPLDP
jgi:hypothetical protein